MSLAPIQILPYVPGAVVTALSEPDGHELNVPRASRSLKKYLPEPVIFEDPDTHELTFSLPVLVEKRELAALEYQEGIRQKRFVGARWFHEVESLYTELEIEDAKQILSARSRGGVLFEEAKLRKRIERELRSAVPDPVKLGRWEGSLRGLPPFTDAARAFELSCSERVSALVVTIKHLKPLYAKAQGWKSKAQRQAACGLFGQQWDSGCGRFFFRRFRCRNRYCPQCGPYVHKQLVTKYLRLKKPVEVFLANPLYRLRVLDITAVKPLKGMPSPEDVRRFKADVKKLIERVNRHIAEKFGLPYSKRLTGYLYCLEFGFENNNLHCHGALLSPFIEQEWLSEQWREIRDDGSFKVWIAEATSFEAVVAHALEYTGKYAASSAERAFELEKAFTGCRRVDGLGWFFNRLPKEEDECDLRCPCGDPACFLKPNLELGWQPLSYFEERGVADLDEARERGSPPREKGGSWVN